MLLRCEVKKSKFKATARPDYMMSVLLCCEQKLWQLVHVNVAAATMVSSEYSAAL